MPVFRKDDKAILYVHIPKAGGSSLERHFMAAGYEMSYRDGRTGPGTDNYWRRCSPQHMHAGLLCELFRLERFTAIFTVTREPLARFRSEYSMRRARALATDAASVEAWSLRVLKKYRANPYILDNHIRPQTEFVLPGSHVYKLEDGLDAVVQDLDGRYDLGLAGGVIRHRTSDKVSGVPSTAIELSEALEARLRDFYRPDFAAFGY